VTRPPRLVLLLQDLEFGGTQRYAIRLLRHLDRRRLSPELWVLRGGEGLAAEALSAGPVAWLSHSTRVGPGALVRLARRLCRERPDALYTLTVVPNIWGRILGRLAGIRVIVAGYRNQHPPQWERLLWRLSDRVLYNAEGLGEELVSQLGVPAERIAFVPNGVEIGPPAEPPRGGPPTALFVGRLEPQKAPLSLLEAFRAVAEALPDARLVIVGEGSLKRAVQERIVHLGLESRVELRGPVEASAVLGEAHLLVLASIYEGSPHVVLEAMAAGLPVVATRVGGVPDLVRHGETGFLVPPGDVQALADRIVRILANPSLGRAMGERARESMRRHCSVENMVAATEELLLESLRRRGLLPPGRADPV